MPHVPATLSTLMATLSTLMNVARSSSRRLSEPSVLPQSLPHTAPPSRFSSWSAWLVILLACTTLVASHVQAANPASARASAQVEQSVNVNAADASQLSSRLKGVGGAKARAIVKYRQQHGDFESLDDLLAVRGIGSKLLADNKDRIRFK